MLQHLFNIVCRANFSAKEDFFENRYETGDNCTNTSVSDRGNWHDQNDVRAWDEKAVVTDKS